MPSIVTQVFLVSVVAGGYVAHAAPAAAVYQVSVVDGTYRVSTGENITIYNVSQGPPDYRVEVQEAVQYNVELPIPFAGRGVPAG